MTLTQVGAALRLLALGTGIALIGSPWSGAPELGALLMLAVLAAQPRRFGVKSPVLVGLLAVWLGMSVLWSVMPGGTLRAAIRTTLVLVVAALLAQTLRWRQITAAMALGGSILCGLALLWLVVDPAAATSSEGLQGMMAHNNSLGYLAAVATVSTLLAHGLPTLIRLPLAVLSVVTLLLTESMTSLLAALLAIFVTAVLLLVRGLPGRVRAAASVLVLGVLGSAAYLVAFVPFATLIGRDTTLTGRTDIWPEVFRVANRHWLTGWGHGAPWLRGSWIREWAHYRFNFPMQTAHNALLENYLQLGVVGVVLVVLLWALAIRRVLTAAAITGQGGWLLAMIVLHLVHGLAEATQGASLCWLIVGMVWLARPSRPGVAELPSAGARRAAG